MDLCFLFPLSIFLYLFVCVVRLSFVLLRKFRRRRSLNTLRSGNYVTGKKLDDNPLLSNGGGRPGKKKSVRLMAVLGSGGHTAEMVRLLQV